MRRAAVLALTLAAGCLPSFEVVVGNGKVVSESREVEDFTEVEFTSGLRGTVEVGSKVPVVLKADENVLAVIKTGVVERRLVFQVDAIGIEPTFGPELAVRGPALEFAGASGGGAVTVKVPAEHPALRVQAVDGATATLDGGKVLALDVFLNGTSKLVAGNSISEQVVVDLREDAEAVLIATKKVSGVIRGNTKLTVHGGPAERLVEVRDRATVTFD